MKKYKCQSCPRGCVLEIKDTAFPWDCSFARCEPTEEYKWIEVEENERIKG